MKKVLVPLMIVFLCSFIFCGCGKESVDLERTETSVSTAPAEFAFNYPVETGDEILRNPDFKSESILIDILKETNAQYSIITEQGETYSGIATTVTKEEMDVSLQENAPVPGSLQKVVDAAAHEVSLLLDVSDPTHVMAMFYLGGRGSQEIEEYYGGFIKYYGLHELKTSCSIKFDKMVHCYMDDSITPCVGIKFIVDVTTEKGVGDLSKVAYIPEVGETTTIEVYISGEYVGDGFGIFTISIDGAEFGRLW